MVSTPTPTVTRVEASAHRFPTDAPESDGTKEWDGTTLVLVRVHAGDAVGIGYTYTGAPAATLVVEDLAPVVLGSDPMRPTAVWVAMQEQVRNLGKPGLVATAISALDIALWDLYANLLGIPLCDAIGAIHDSVPVYGSGGFTSYDDRQLSDQLSGWVEAGIPRVKIKVGRRPEEDLHRLEVARSAIGDSVELYVDANGAFSAKQALGWARRYRDFGVRWFEEPVSSDDLDGLRLVREHGPGGMDVAAGEYGYHLPYFQHMLDAGGVDCLQADVTRALGVSGVLRVAGLCDARSMDLSLHCAPQISAHVGTAIWHLRHLEYFHDHVRIESMVFDGALAPGTDGALRPDRSAVGLGVAARPDVLDAHQVAGGGTTTTCPRRSPERQ